jgi:hypothetical protein
MFSFISRELVVFPKLVATFPKIWPDGSLRISDSSPPFASCHHQHFLAARRPSVQLLLQHRRPLSLDPLVAASIAHRRLLYRLSMPFLVGLPEAKKKDLYVHLGCVVVKHKLLRWMLWPSSVPSTLSASPYHPQEESAHPAAWQVHGSVAQGAAHLDASLLRKERNEKSQLCRDFCNPVFRNVFHKTRFPGFVKTEFFISTYLLEVPNKVLVC